MSGTAYFDRQGKPITVDEWARRRDDESYGVLAEEHVGDVVIKTIWLGLNVYFSDPPAGLFGTGVCTAGKWEEVETYDTEAEALRGHQHHVKTRRDAN